MKHLRKFLRIILICFCRKAMSVGSYLTSMTSDGERRHNLELISSSNSNYKMIKDDAYLCSGIEVGRRISWERWGRLEISLGQISPAWSRPPDFLRQSGSVCSSAKSAPREVGRRISWRNLRQGCNLQKKRFLLQRSLGKCFQPNLIARIVNLLLCLTLSLKLETEDSNAIHTASNDYLPTLCTQKFHSRRGICRLNKWVDKL